MELWNRRKLQGPPTSTCLIRTQELNLEELYTLFADTSSLFSSQIYLVVECKFLHSIVRRYKLKYRTSIGYKCIQKLNRAMRVFQQVDYQQVVAYFTELMPRKYEESTYFPSLNLLDHILVRTQGVAMLIVRALETAVNACKHWQDQLHLGHNLGISITIIGICSRIFIIMRYLVQCLCEFYNKTVLLRPLLPNVKFNWLPTDYTFPKTLMPWLDIDWAFIEDKLDLEVTYKGLFSIELFEDEDVEFCRQYTIIEDDDVEVMNEYMTLIESSDECSMVEAIRGDLKRVNAQTKAALGTLVKPEVVRLDVDEDIGAPAQLNARVAEVVDKLKMAKDLPMLLQFIKDNKHTYFRSLGNVRYQKLLYSVETQIFAMPNLNVGRRQPKKIYAKRLLKELKQNIKELIQSEDAREGF